MARRRRDGSDEKRDLGFDVPEFDEDEFIRKETISFRTTLILFLYSIATALVTFVVWAYTTDSWLLSLVIAGATGYLLRYIYPALKVDISHFGKKEWTGTGFLYFFSWLAFFIFLTNPPLHDGVPPQFEIHVTPDAQDPVGPVHISLVAADNLGIDEGTITFSVTDPDGTTIADTDDLTREGSTHVWSWESTFTQDDIGTYTVRGSIQDTGNALLARATHTTQAETTFRVGDAITVRMSGTDADGVGHLQTSGDRVEVVLDPALDVYRAWLQLDNNTRVPLAHDRDLSNDQQTVYYATADHPGFGQGNNTFTVHVTEHDSYFLSARYGSDPIEAPLVSADTYTVVIEDPSLLGDAKVKQDSMRDPTPAATPGFGALFAVAALVGVVVVARRRQS